jgi:UDP-N-acetylmuramoyl-tripeptide--D-alanyl-D-alanine ligase
MVEFIIKIVAVILIVFYAALRLRYELQMMQQNSYRLSRYLRWLKDDLTKVSRITDVLMLAVIGIFLGNRWEIYAFGLMGAVALWKSARELLAKYKKPLVFTARAVRLYAVGVAVIVLSVLLAWWFWGLNMAVLKAMALVVFSPIVMCIALVLLMPV